MTKSKLPKTRYCKYYHMCDKDINCRDKDVCSVFEHTEDFSSLRFENDNNEVDYIKDTINLLFDS